MDALMNMATGLVASYVGHNQTPMADVPGFIKSVHTTLAQLQSGQASETKPPAVSVKKSVQDGYIVCLEDGKRLSMLKRYLWTHYKLTPEAYRQKWNLPPDYPMVAPAYARLRSEFAKSIGLGKKSAGRPRKARKS